jgi:small-conductance mechanosensitive channel
MGEWEELEALAAQAQRDLDESSEGLRRSVRGGAGSPVEQRIAQAFQDQAKVSSAIEAELARLHRESAALAVLLNDVKGSLEANERALKAAKQELGDGAYRATQKALERQSRALGSMEEQAEATISALGKLDESAAENYKETVEGSCKRLTRSTAIATSTILISACAGSFFALVGMWWVTQAVPFFQQLVTDWPWFPLAFLAIIVGLLLGIAEWASRRPR